MKYLKHMFVNHNNPDYQPAFTAWAPEKYEPYFIKTKKWCQCSAKDHNGIQCTIHISDERWKKLSQIEKQEVMNHTHEYPRIDLYYEQVDPHHDNENVNTPKVELTSNEKRILILVGKKKFINQLCNFRFI